MFTDEKIFSIQQTYNRQNNRTWAENSDLVRKNDVQTSQKPKGVMVWELQEMETLDFFQGRT